MLHARRERVEVLRRTPLRRAALVPVCCGEQESLPAISNSSGQAASFSHAAGMQPQLMETSHARAASYSFVCISETFWQQYDA